MIVKLSNLLNKFCTNVEGDTRWIFQHECDCFSIVCFFNTLFILKGKRYLCFNSTSSFPGCKCGIDNSCATSGHLCNCDTNDYTWRFDEGYITDKQRLPLTEVRLGDTGAAVEYGKFIIGQLECTEL